MKCGHEESAEGGEPKDPSPDIKIDLDRLTFSINGKEYKDT